MQNHIYDMISLLWHCGKWKTLGTEIISVVAEGCRLGREGLLKDMRKLFSSVQFSSVQSLSCVRLFATPWIAARQASLSITNSWSLPHAHQVGDAIQPSHPLSSPSLPAPNPSQHQGLFQWVNSSHEVAKVLEFQLQHQFFQWTPRTDLLQDGLVGSPCSPRDSQDSSPIPQFKSINFSALSFLHSPTLTSIHDHWNY